MAFDPIKLRVLAEKNEDENWRFRDFLKRRCRLDPDEIDERVFELTKRVWAKIDCTTCANCCKKIRPTFSEADIVGLSQFLGIDRQQFIQTFLQPTRSSSDNPWITRSTPCPFLKGSLCSVYEHRPADCRGYPYLYEPDFTFRLMGMLGRTFTCPIVFEVMEELKQTVRFGGHRGR